MSIKLADGCAFLTEMNSRKLLNLSHNLIRLKGKGPVEVGTG